MTLTSVQAEALTRSSKSFFRVFMPYVYQRIEVSGRTHAFLPLNRAYKPLGVRHDAGHVDYEPFVATHAVFFSRDPATLEGVWWNQRDENLWLYDDSAKSRVDYSARFERLLTQQIVLVG